MTTRRYRKESVDMKNASKIRFTDISVQPSDVFIGADFVAQENNDTTYYNRGEKGRTLQEIPFQIGYQSPDEICFTRNSIDKLNLIRIHDLLSLNRKILNPGPHLNLQIRLVFHYPGQLIRNFDKPSFISAVGSYNGDKVLELIVYQVTKLINRQDANVPCSNGVEVDDLTFLRKINTLIGCTPVYWKDRLPNAKNAKICDSPEELRYAASHIKYYKDILSTYDPPCFDMKTIVQYFKQSNQRQQQFVIKIDYRDSVFQEIKNVKDFTFPTFWSNVGGLLGICLGYSFLQIPGLIHNLFSFLKRSQYAERLSK